MVGVSFNGYHSFDYFGLILTSKSINLPSPKTDTVDITGGDGLIDMSTALTGGDIKFKNRTIDMTFTVIDPSINWEGVKSKFATIVHGNKCKIVFDIDKYFYYVGRVTIDKWKEDRRTGTLTVKVDAEPYKYDLTSSTEPWIWDTFDFRYGITYHYGSMPIDIHGLELDIPSRRQWIVPKFTCSSATKLTFNGVEYTIPGGVVDYRDLHIIFKEGANHCKFNLISATSGTISINYTGGTL